MFAAFHRKKFVRGRTPLSDEEFALQIGARPELQRAIATVREALASVCHVPAKFLYPDDEPKSVVKLLTFDWDDVSVVMELERLLGIAIEDRIPPFLERRCFFWCKEAGPQTVGEWCIRVAECLQSKHVG